MSLQSLVISERFEQLLGLLPRIAESIRLLPGPELQRDAFRLLLRELTLAGSAASRGIADSLDGGISQLSADHIGEGRQRNPAEMETDIAREDLRELETMPVAGTIPSLFGASFHDSILDELAGDANRDGDESVHSFLIQ